MKLGTEMRQGARDITLASRIFLAAALVAMAAVIALLAYNQGAFTPTINAYFFAGTADGMNKGMAVKLAGFKVGSVDSITINRDLRVLVGMKIDSQYAEMIDLDAVVRLTKEALLSGNVLEIRPGSGDRGPVSDKVVLTYEREPGIEGAVAGLIGQMSPIVADVRRITAYLSSPDSDFRQAIRNVNRTASSLAEASERMKGLIAAAEKRVEQSGERAGSVLQNADALIGDARASLAVLDGSLKKIDSALPGMTAKMDQSLDNIRAASEAMRALAGGELRGMLGEANDLVSEANAVLRGAKQSWPVRNFVMPPQERLLPLDGGGGIGAAAPGTGGGR